MHARMPTPAQTNQCWRTRTNACMHCPHAHAMHADATHTCTAPCTPRHTRTHACTPKPRMHVHACVALACTLCTLPPCTPRRCQARTHQRMHALPPCTLPRTHARTHADAAHARTNVFTHHRQIWLPSGWVLTELGANWLGHLHLAAQLVSRHLVISLGPSGHLVFLPRAAAGAGPGSIPKRAPAQRKARMECAAGIKGRGVCGCVRR